MSCNTLKKSSNRNPPTRNILCVALPVLIMQLGFLSVCMCVCVCVCGPKNSDISTPIAQLPQRIFYDPPPIQCSLSEHISGHGFFVPNFSSQGSPSKNWGHKFGNPHYPSFNVFGLRFLFSFQHLAPAAGASLPPSPSPGPGEPESGTRRDVGCSPNSGLEQPRAPTSAPLELQVPPFEHPGTSLGAISKRSKEKTKLVGTGEIAHAVHGVS
jgi:hypothetical protein